MTMRIAATTALLLLVLQSCASAPAPSTSEFLEPNSLMAGEITRRVEQIPFQHRDELLQNLLWLSNAGEQVIPAVLTGLTDDNPKTRSSCAFVLGRLRDRRTAPQLQAAMEDSDPTVRMECGRTLVLMGDLEWSPVLIEGLDSDRKEVRYLCHEALKTASGHDFGYDHLNQNRQDLMASALRWRQWWSDYSGDATFAADYQQKNNLSAQPAVPMGEIKVQPKRMTPIEQPPIQSEELPAFPGTPNGGSGQTPNGQGMTTSTGGGN
jgi:hypothetical protein